MTPTALPSDEATVLEFRQYRLHPGMRDTLIDVFEAAFIEGQEELGMTIPGQFRDLDDADSFVWLRGFRDMEARRQALTAFYSGPVWLANRDAANATMISFDNVLLLRPAAEGSGFSLDGADRPAIGVKARSGVVTATICQLGDGLDEFARYFERSVKPLLARSGAKMLGAFRTEPAENSYPRLPVREGERAFVWFCGFADDQAMEKQKETLDHEAEWVTAMAEIVARCAGNAPVTLRLSPTARSLVRG
jgi:hypothetical protein